MKKFLVTGGAGFIGSNICERLLKEGHQVRILDDLSTGKEENIKSILSDVEFHKGDIRNITLVEKLSKGIDFILHHAAISSVHVSIRNPILMSDINVMGTLNVLKSAKDMGVKRVIIASSASVYGNNKEPVKKEDMKIEPISPYAVTKCSLEMYAKVFSEIFDLETVCLRYFNVFGPRQLPDSAYSGVISTFIDAVKKEREIVIYGDGEQTRDFIYVDDVVSSNIFAAMSQKVGHGEIINIATGQSKSLNQLIAALKNISGRDFSVRYEPVRKGDIRDSKADVTNARELLGFEYRTEFEEGLKKLYESN